MNWCIFSTFSLFQFGDMWPKSVNSQLMFALFTILCKNFVSGGVFSVLKQFVKNLLLINSFVPNITCTCHTVWCWKCQMSSMDDGHFSISLFSLCLNSGLLYMRLGIWFWCQRVKAYYYTGQEQSQNACNTSTLECQLHNNTVFCYSNTTQTHSKITWQ